MRIIRLYCQNRVSNSPHYFHCSVDLILVCGGYVKLIDAWMLIDSRIFPNDAIPVLIQPEWRVDRVHVN